MKTVSNLFIIAAAALLIGFIPLLKAADKAEGASELKKQLLGEWELVSTADGKPVEGHAGEYKFIGSKHWTVIRPNPETRQLDYALGGTYTLDGDEYVESIEFASANISNMIGAKNRFKVKVEGDKFTQIGQGNPYSQQFRRAK